jgi:Mrp family chromosome partitioning ATPase
MSLLASYRASSGENAVAVRSFSDGDDTNDEFRLIKWHFLARAASGEVAGRNPRVLLVTSAARGEGKSYVAHHLAANFALDPHIQLTLIDANFDNPALGSSSWLGGSSGGAGLLDYLENASMDQSSIIKSTGLGNVRAILSGSARGNAPELLSDARVERLMVLTDANSFVIIDAGPILNGSGAAVLARVAGHIAFVVASNRTSRNQINKALGTLDRIAGPIDEKSLGLIFN